MFEGQTSLSSFAACPMVDKEFQDAMVARVGHFARMVRFTSVRI